MARSAVTFLMFGGKAEEAMNLYVSAFRGARITRLQRYEAGEPGVEGTVKEAYLEVGGYSLRFFDSHIEHKFTFTPSISIFIECEDEAELTTAFNTLTSGGAVLMPLDNYGFSTRFAWVNDRFGVSWQLNLQ